LLQTFRCAAPLEHSLMKPKAKPQRGVILIAQNDSSLSLRCSAPEYPGKPQHGEMFVELVCKKEFGGAAYRNMKLDCLELDFTGDNNVSLRCSF